MPIFEYACNDCGEEFEKLVFAGTTVQCPKCSAGNIRKKMSTFGMSGGEKPPAAGSSSGCSSCSGGSCSTCK
ncbi:MAG: FmdB family transcriptional regulator [Thermodesulfovibrio sp.]|nr:FmdB family transcriptional regulator [Thermodesulfovibrio sp.]